MDGELDALLPNGWSAVVFRQGGNGQPVTLRAELLYCGEMRCLIVAINQSTPEAAFSRVRLAVEGFLLRQERVHKHAAFRPSQ
ncbi:hypothetical protein ABL849_33425 (plasmid) [Variovorax sp. 375MFSha3.1]|uniref:hypothetical protein n=1 Tax=unclassified Variovorax TaxID=663243 RepID=UPI003AADA875